MKYAIFIGIASSLIAISLGSFAMEKQNEKGILTLQCRYHSITFGSEIIEIMKISENHWEIDEFHFVKHDPDREETDGSIYKNSVKTIFRNTGDILHTAELHFPRIQDGPIIHLSAKGTCIKINLEANKF